MCREGEDLHIQVRMDECNRSLHSGKGLAHKRLRAVHLLLSNDGVGLEVGDQEAWATVPSSITSQTNED